MKKKRRGDLKGIQASNLYNSKQWTVICVRGNVKFVLHADVEHLLMFLLYTAFIVFGKSNFRVLYIALYYKVAFRSTYNYDLIQVIFYLDRFGLSKTI